MLAVHLITLCADGHLFNGPFLTCHGLYIIATTVVLIVQAIFFLNTDPQLWMHTNTGMGSYNCIG